MKRVVHKSQSFDEAARWDVEQQIAMSPQERIRAARELQRRAYGSQVKDVRECHAKR